MNGHLHFTALVAGVIGFASGFLVNKIANAADLKTKWDSFWIKREEGGENDYVQDEMIQNHENLTETEEENSSVAPELPEAPPMNRLLLSFAFRPALLRILNQSDPVSFMRMASTCREMRTICLNSRGIKVKFPCKVVFVKDLNGIVHGIRFKYLRGKEGYLTVNGASLRNLQKLPFHFDIKVKFSYAWFLKPDDVADVDSFIRRFPIFSIRKLYVDPEGDIGCWPQLLTFIQEHRIKRFTARDFYIKEEVKESLLKEKFESVKLATTIPRGLLWEIGARTLYIENSDVNAEDFVHLVRCIGRNEVTDIDEWCFDHINENFCTAEAFISSFDEFKKIPFTHEGPLPSERPLVTFENENNAYFLTSSNETVSFNHYAITKTLIVFPPDGSFTQVPAVFASS